MSSNERTERPCGVARFFRRRWAYFAAPLLMVISALAGLSWWMTEPLDEALADTTASQSENTTLPESPALPAPAETAALALVPEAGSVQAAPGAACTQAKAESAELAWPEQRLDGDAAKKLLLQALLEADERLERIGGYTATFRKQERIEGKLGEEQTIEIKVRNRPFAVYFKYLGSQAGKEVVYAEGRHENKLIAHSSGWSRRLLPRLAVPPTHPLALAENRHPITDAGLATLTRKLLSYRRMDLLDAEAITVLDRTNGPDGRPLPRSLHLHYNRKSERPFTRVEVLYDAETFIPIEITNYDWPEPGQPNAEPLLAEHYAYGDLRLGVNLTDVDFDPANPAYAFHRY